MFKNNQPSCLKITFPKLNQSCHTCLANFLKYGDLSSEGVGGGQDVESDIMGHVINDIDYKQKRPSIIETLLLSHTYTSRYGIPVFTWNTQLFAPRYD